MPQERGRGLLQGFDQRPGNDPTADDGSQQNHTSDPFPQENTVSRRIDRGGATKDAEPAAHHRNAGKDRGENHQNATVKVVGKTPGNDQVIGHEGERAREPEAGEGEEQKKTGQRRGIPKPPLRQVEPKRPCAALERRSHDANPSE